MTKPATQKSFRIDPKSWRKPSEGCEYVSPAGTIEKLSDHKPGLCELEPMT
jgi:hypothetical protein